MTSPDVFFFQMTLGDDILDTAGNVVLDTNSEVVTDVGGWTDVQDDVLSVPSVIKQGQTSASDPRDRVADAGSIKFQLNNAANNSGGVVGYYSPDSPNCRPGFGLGLSVRVGIEYNATTYWLSQGKIISIEPEPGLLGNKRVDVTAGDWLELAARTPMPRVEVQQSKTDDQLIQTIVDALGTDAPTETDLDTGNYTYQYALTAHNDQLTPVMTVLQQIAQCGQGRIFITGGSNSGEVLRYVSLSNILTIVDPVATYTNQFISADARRHLRTRIRRVITTAYPMAKDASPVVLYVLTNPLTISAGAELEFTGTFRDPNASDSRTIAAVNVIEPVAATDFNFSTSSGSGSDLNASLTVQTWEPGARSFRIKVKNTSGSTGYLWQFQVRGEGLYPYDEIGYTAIDSTIAEKDGTTLDYDLPFHSVYTIMVEIADALLAWYSVENTEMPYIDIVATADDDTFQKFLDSKPGEIIAVSEGVTGISANFIVTGREVRIAQAGRHITARLYITPTLQLGSGLYFTLDTLGLDDLDGTNTVLAFGS